MDSTTTKTYPTVQCRLQGSGREFGFSKCEHLSSKTTELSSSRVHTIFFSNFPEKLHMRSYNHFVEYCATTLKKNLGSNLYDRDFI